MEQLWAPWRMELIEKGDAKQACIFCDLPRSPDDRQNLILGRTPHTFAILNRYPYNNGHLMVVPRAHEADLASLPRDQHEELAEMLRISPAAVSGAVRYLIQLGLVHKERVPGSRRDYYRMPDDVWHDMLRLRDQVMTRWTALIREGIDLVGPDTPAGARLAEHAAFFEFVARELPEVLTRWDKYRASEASG